MDVWLQWCEDDFPLAATNPTVSDSVSFDMNLLLSVRMPVDFLTFCLAGWCS